MRNPWMRDEQIVASWRQAKDRRAQVKILAELNAVPRSVIEEILIAHGCDIGKKKKTAVKRDAKKPWAESDDLRLTEMHKNGVPYEEIAEMLGRTVGAVKYRIFELKKKEKEKPMNGNSWTSDEVAFMLERRKQGVDVRHIAAEMGRTVPAINSKLKKLRMEGKKIAAEIEAEEKAKTTVKGLPPDETITKAATIADRVIRLADDYKKVAALVGASPDVHIDASCDGATLFAKSGGAAILLRETAQR